MSVSVEKVNINPVKKTDKIEGRRLIPLPFITALYSTGDGRSRVCASTIFKPMACPSSRWVCQWFSHCSLASQLE
jgi:hypothetical protein